MSSATRKYGELPWSQTFSLVATLIPLPLVLLWTILFTARASHNKERSMKRIIGDRTLRYCVTNLKVAQAQYAFGTTLSVYTKWTKKTKLPVIIDELGEDARLLWIGPKQTDRVLYFCHGGCFFLPMTDFGSNIILCKCHSQNSDYFVCCRLDLLRYVQVELEKQKIEIGIAVLQYSLAPMATFPTPLNQARLGLEFLFAAGVKPHNLQIFGDSAGGNLILQLVSQMLHPVQSIPKIQPTSPIRGICLLSPWASLTADTESAAKYDGIDTMPKRGLADWGAQILAGFAQSDGAFAEPAKAPEAWFKGVNSLVDRVLIVAGEMECMRDDIVQLGEGLKRHHPDVRVAVQAGGLHDDMLLDFMVKETKLLGTSTALITSWLAAGFSESF
ncbi:Alpha/Beta hydrolase protein [Mycena vitilis]|nr:Alpha/Beta hydrolase protein [Mycena vitilis]